MAGHPDVETDAARFISVASIDLGALIADARAQVHKKLDGEVGHHELETAIAVWNRYLDSKPDIDIIFEKFDKNQSGKLEAYQLKAFLTELNDDIEPTDEEVKFILDSADGAVEGVSKTGGINRTELTQAISLWYAHTDKMQKKCCSIM